MNHCTCNQGRLPCVCRDELANGSTISPRRGGAETFVAVIAAVAVSVLAIAVVGVCVVLVKLVVLALTLPVAVPGVMT